MPLTLDEIERQFLAAIPITSLIQDLQRIYRESPRSSLERARSAFLIGAYYVEGKNNGEAAPYYEEAHKIALDCNDEKVLADTMHGLALTAFGKGDYRTTNRLEEEVLEISLRLDNANRIASCYFMLGTVAKIYGAHESTADYFGRALKIALDKGLLKIELSSLAKLSELCLLSRNIPKARNYADNCLKAAIRMQNDDEIAKAKIRLATIEVELGDYDEVVRLTNEVRETLPASNKSVWSVIHTLMGNVYRAKKKWVNAETEFEEALKCAIYPNAEKVRSNIQLNFADYYLSRKLYSKALQHARKSLAEAEKLGHIYFRKEAFRMLHDCHKALNQFKQAYKYLEEYNNIVSESDNDLLRSRLDFHELRYDFEAERAKAEEGRRQAGLLQAELELKERELTEKTRHLIKQTEALSQFRNDLKVMIRRSPADDPLVKSIRERLHEMPEPQVNWEDFDAQFKSVHPLFLHNLTTAYPTLTPMERKICPFLRLNLTSEDIAKLLFLSDRNIENHRYRIRRKFGLGTSASLPEFLEKF